MRNKAYLIAGLVALALFFGLFGTMAHAQPLTNYDLLFRFNRSYDSWTLDSAYALVLDGSVASDSGLRVPYDTLRYGGRKDTLTFVVSVSATTISKVHNPSVMMCVYPSTMAGKPFCEVQPIAHMIHSADTARSANASLVIDSASLAAIIAAINAGLGGNGDYPETLFVYDTLQDALVMGARVAVFAPDTGSYQNSSGLQATDLFGKVIYSLDAGTFPVAISSQGYFQEGAYQLVNVAGPGGRDTVWVYSLTFNPPSGADSTLLLIFTDAPLGAVATFTPDYNTQDSSDVLLRADIVTKKADANGVIQVTLPRTSSTRNKRVYDIEVKTTGQRATIMLHRDDYVIPDVAIDTLRVRDED